MIWMNKVIAYNTEIMNRSGKQVIKKIKNQKGFSLAEMLLAILILLLVSVIVANGVPAAQSAYEKVVIGANAKVLLSTTISALRDELATATNVTVATDKKTITYYSADKGAASELYIVEENGIPVIKLKEYSSADPIEFNEDKTIYSDKVRNLVSEKAATGDLYVTYDSIENYTIGDESTITIKGLKVGRKSKTTELATADLTIRFIIPAKVE